MNGATIDHDQTDEDILTHEDIFTYEVSDEALERAAGTGRDLYATNFSFFVCCAF